MAEWEDKPLPEDPHIRAAFPTQSGRHDLYAEAMRLVGAKRSKGNLVALVNWLLYRIDSLQKLDVERRRATEALEDARERGGDWEP